MNLLLDTHIWLWWLADDQRLSLKARELIGDMSNTLLVSSISVWEVVIKAELGKIRVQSDLCEATLAQGIQFLDFEVADAVRVSHLPVHHRDPFDRALLAQAVRNGLRLLTADAQLLEYKPGVDILHAS